MAQHYDLFFSYRHKPLDTDITEKCFQFVEKFRMPENLQRQGYEGVRRAFRDKEELSVSRILTETIDSALRSAEHLVIVCTKQTPQSEWVDREIQIFIELGKAGNIYPLLVEGTPEEAFTPSLKKIPDIMERVMDVRSAGNDVKAIMTKAQKELVRVIAAVSGCEEERLRRELKLTKNRKTAIRAGGSVALFTFVGVFSAILCGMAVSYRAEAKAAQETSMTILRETTYSLPDSFVNIKTEGVYSRVADILLENTLQMNKILELSEDASNVREEIKANYDKLAEAYRTIGSFAEAEDEAQRVIETVKQRTEEIGDGGQLLASAYNNKARILAAQAKYEDAIAGFDEAIVCQEKVPDGKGGLAIYYSNKASTVWSGGDAAEGIALSEKAVVLATEKDVNISLVEKANIFSRHGQLLLASNMENKDAYYQAEEALKKAAELYEAAVEKVWTLKNQELLIQAKARLAYCYTVEGKYTEAEAVYEQILPMTEELAQDGENVDYLYLLAELTNNYGLLESEMRNFERADQLYRESADAYGVIAERINTTEIKCTYAETLANVACNAIMHGNREEAEQYFSMSFAEFSAMEDELSDYYKGLYYGYRSYKKIMLDHDFIGACADGEKATEAFESIFTYTCAAYAYMLAGQHEICDSYFGSLATTGEGTIQSILTDFDAMERNGVSCDHMQYVREKILLAQ